MCYDKGLSQQGPMEKQEMEMKRKLETENGNGNWKQKMEMETGNRNGYKIHTNHWCNVFFIVCLAIILLYST